MRKANFSKQSHLFIKTNHHSKAILAGPRRNGLLETSLRQDLHHPATTRPQHTCLTSGHSPTRNGTPLCLWNATSSLPRAYTCLLCWQQSYSSKLSNNLKRRIRHSDHVTCWVPRVRTHRKGSCEARVCPAITSPGNFTITHICRNYRTGSNNMIKEVTQLTF